MSRSIYSLTIIFAALSSALSAPTIHHRSSAIGILPIIECPDPQDSTNPVVIYPSIPGIPNLAANQYVVCFHGEPIIFNCSEGLFFNWSTMSCDFPYERASNNGENSSELGDLEDLVPAGPIQVPVPISPQYPVPIWSRSGNRGGHPGPINYPIPPHPITKPDPDVIMPVPVLPAHPPPFRPVPYQ